MTTAEYLRYFLAANRLRQREIERVKERDKQHRLLCHSEEQREKDLINKKEKPHGYSNRRTGTGFSVSDRRINKWLGLHCHHWLLGGVLLLNLLETKKESERVKAQLERERERDKYNTKNFRDRARERGNRYLKRRKKKDRDKETDLRREL